METHNDHLLPICPPESLCPPNLSGIPLHLEILMTFRSTEPETLRIIPHEHRTMAWVDVDRAEVALFNTHGGRVWVIG